MEKYYDLIISLIKANRKYSYCEAIVDEIVNDVYKHAEVVLNTVTNEEVVTSYLNKIVTTSMITVPRRLGIQTHKQDNVTVAPVIISEKQSTNIEIAEEEPSDEVDNSEYAEIFADESEVSDDAEELTELAVNDEADTEDDDIILSDDDDDDDDEIEESDNILESDEVEVVEEDVQDVVVDKTLVDKMINGVSEVEIPEENCTDGEPASDDNEVLDLSDFESSVTDDILGENSDLSLEETDVCDLEDTVDDMSVTLSDDDELIDLSEPEDIQLPEESTNTSIKIPSYDCFVFEPVDKSNEIVDSIQEIENVQKNHSDINVSAIVKLKYCDKLSVSDISSKLDLSEDVILEILKELVYSVKD